MKLSLLSLAAISVSIAATAAVVSPTRIDKIIAYADSFTDNGNVFSHTNFPPTPPYYQGRFSNGPTWLEYVNQNLIGVAVMNYGYAYATTNNVDVYSQVGNYIVPGLKQQVETIFVNGTSKDLYVIFFGYNDLNAILNPNIYYTINKRYSKEKVVQNVIESVQQLVKMYGAKHFLIMTAPPFDQFPAFKGIRQQETTQLIKDYNALLQSRLLQKVKGVDIKFLDDNAWLLEQLAHPEKVNVKTTSEPCVWGLGNTTSCDDAENHFFWDSFHPTTKVHQAMGEWVVSQLKGLYELKHH